tara:strand:- start:2012 stop:2980 length:969 start_codon:yes stop_codon:yes gene_type:complete
LKKYLVTGGSGFIGSALVKGLLGKGNYVRVFDNNSRGNLRRLNDVIDNIDFFKGDIRNIDDCEEACEGIDSVCHLAFVNGTEYFYEKPELVLEVGVKGMMNILDASLKKNIKELILASSSEVYQTPKLVPTDETTELIIPDPMNPRYSYGGGKLISELLTINYGRKYFDRTIIFRPHNVYGPDMGWEHVIPQFILRMNELIKEDPDKIAFPIQGSGEETRAFIYIEDFISGLLKVIDNGENLNIYHIGNESEIAMKELAESIGKIFDKNIEVIPGELTHGSTLRRCPDITKIKALGYKPKHTLNDGLLKTIEWYNNNLDLKI